MFRDSVPTVQTGPQGKPHQPSSQVIALAWSAFFGAQDGQKTPCIVRRDVTRIKLITYQKITYRGCALTAPHEEQVAGSIG